MRKDFFEAYRKVTAAGLGFALMAAACFLPGCGSERTDASFPGFAAENDGNTACCAKDGIWGAEGVVEDVTYGTEGLYHADDGIYDASYNGPAVLLEDGLAYRVGSGTAEGLYNGFYGEEDGMAVYYENGERSHHTGGVIAELYGKQYLYYIEDGLLRTDYTGFGVYGGGWYYFKDGRFEEMQGIHAISGTVDGEYGDWYVVSPGVVDTSALRTLLDTDADGNERIWAVVNGRVYFLTPGFEADADGNVASVDFAYPVKGASQEAADTANEMLAKLPVNILQRFMDEQAVIIVSDGKEWLAPGGEDDYVAMYLYGPEMLFILDGEGTYDSVVLHEMGHFVDGEYGRSLSASGEWSAIFTEERDAFCGCFADADDGITDCSTPDEYFAEAFRQYILNPEKLKEDTPGSYKYIKTAVESF